MKSWRLSWVLDQVSDLASFANHRRALVSPGKFWLALALKFFPIIWPFPIRLRLRQGGVLGVQEFMTLYIYNEVFVDGCYDVPLASTPAFILDVGANTGLFIIRMKQLYPDAEVLGFEPLPANYVQLQRNIEWSNLRGVKTRMQGVGGSTRKEKLYVHPRNIGGHSIYPDQAMDGRSVEIDIVGLPELLGSMPSKRCGLLKLDCEGAEFEIIKSIDATMAERIDNVVFEPTPSVCDPAVLVRHLEALGYRVGNHKGLRWAYR